ncbi:hypothetical protein Trydic_g5373 [Trypoxylus dichotomus]
MRNYWHREEDAHREEPVSPAVVVPNRRGDRSHGSGRNRNTSICWRFSRSNLRHQCRRISQNSIGGMGVGVHVLFNNKVALQTFGPAKVSSRLVPGCRNSLNVLSSYNKAILIWIPGHNYIKGNEAASELPKLHCNLSFWLTYLIMLPIYTLIEQ